MQSRENELDERMESRTEDHLEAGLLLNTIFKNSSPSHEVEAMRRPAENKNRRWRQEVQL